MKSAAIVFGFAVLLSSFAPSASAGVRDAECPWVPIADRPAEAIAAMMPPAESLRDLAALPDIVSSLRQHGLTSGIIVDSLVSTYCPLVAGDAALSEAQKSSAIQRFAASVRNVVYAYSGADQIILDVTLPTAVVTAAQAKAKAAGVSVEDWIAKLVDQAAGAP
jgi:hypothetical protein